MLRPSVPFGRDVVVMVNWPAPMVSVRSTVTECTGVAESLNLKVSGAAVTGVVGVPLISPVVAFRVRPSGNVPEVNCQLVAGTPPLKARVCE